MRVERVAPQHVALLWPKAAPFICKALARQPIELYGEWDVERALLNGHPWTLWIVRDGETLVGAIVTRIDDYPRARGCLIFACGGAGIVRWFDAAQEVIEGYARQLGCRFIQAQGRRGWLRYSGARCDDYVMRKDL